MMRRRGRPIARAVVGTAVIAGTAGAVHHHQEQKWANQEAQKQAEAEAAYQEAQAAAQPVYVEAPPAAPTIDVEQLKQLGELHTAGVLSDEEFAALKAKLVNA